jgi:hypothetical protein
MGCGFADSSIEAMHSITSLGIRSPGSTRNHAPGFQIECGHAFDDVLHATLTIKDRRAVSPACRCALCARSRPASASTASSGSVVAATRRAKLIGNVEALCQSIDPGRVFIREIPSAAAGRQSRRRGSSGRCALALDHLAFREFRKLWPKGRGKSRTTSTGFSWIPAYGQKIDRPIPYSGARIPCSAKIIPCSAEKIPCSIC